MFSLKKKRKSNKEKGWHKMRSVDAMGEILVLCKFLAKVQCIKDTFFSFVKR